MTEERELTSSELASSETTALWNMRVVLPDDCRRLVKLMAANGDWNIPQTIELAIRTLARQEGITIPVPDASSPRFARAS